MVGQFTQARTAGGVMFQLRRSDAGTHVVDQLVMPDGLSEATLWGAILILPAMCLLACGRHILKNEGNFLLLSQFANIPTKDHGTL